MRKEKRKIMLMVSVAYSVGMESVEGGCAVAPHTASRDEEEEQHEDDCDCDLDRGKRKNKEGGLEDSIERQVGR